VSSLLFSTKAADDAEGPARKVLYRRRGRCTATESNSVRGLSSKHSKHPLSPSFSPSLSLSFSLSLCFSLRLSLFAHLRKCREPEESRRISKRACVPLCRTLPHVTVQFTGARSQRSSPRIARGARTQQPPVDSGPHFPSRAADLARSTFEKRDSNSRRDAADLTFDEFRCWLSCVPRTVSESREMHGVPRDSSANTRGDTEREFPGRIARGARSFSLGARVQCSSVGLAVALAAAGPRHRSTGVQHRGFVAFDESARTVARARSRYFDCTMRLLSRCCSASRRPR